MTTRFRTCCRFSSIILLLCCLAAMAAAVEVPFLTEHTVENTQRSDWLDSGDVDGDGDPDLVTANCDGDTFSLWRNDGDATSWTQVVIDSTSTVCPRMIRLADLDADGDLDAFGTAASGTGVGGSLHWFENDGGTGSSWTTHAVTTGLEGAYWTEAADMDADGDLDLTAALGNRIVWWSNDGGSWTEHEVATGFMEARSASPADVDGDGDLDLIGTSFGDDEILWWSNDGACTPGCSWSATTIGILDEANTVSTADLDGDGDLDVVVAGHGSGVIGWWENTAGTGATWAAHTLSTTEPLSWAVATADLDDDGDLDVVGTSIGDYDLTWWENDGSNCDPDCSWPERDIDNHFKWVEAVVMVDLDRDGDLDVVGGSQGAGIAWWENETLHRSAFFPVHETISQDINYTGLVGATDLDNDGDLDVVIGTAHFANRPSVVVVENTSTTTTTWSAAQQIASLGTIYTIALGDIDDDGFDDIVAGSYNADKVYWLRNPGTVLGTWTSSTVASAFGDPLGLGVADLDADGDLDIVGAARADGVSWFENDALSWTEHVMDATMTGAQAAEIGDIDGDGDLDVFSAASQADRMRWWANDGGSPLTWTAHDVATVSNSKADLVDLDGDGDLDVVTSGDNVAWWENTDGGGITWSEHVVQATVTNINSVSAVDVDADGDQDIVGADMWNVTWWENSTGDGLSWIAHSLPGRMTGGGWRSTPVADVDRDGRMDVISGTWGESNLWWWRNVGGQFALPTEDAVSEAILDEGATDVPLLRIDGLHRGRTGDDDAEIATLELLFEEDAADPLTGGELDALVDTLRLYLDDGDDAFDPGLDTAFFSLGSPFTLTDGVLTLTLVDDDPNVQLPVGAGETYFLAADLTADAGAATPDAFQVTHLTSASSTGEMASTDIPLRLEGSADVTSTRVEINEPPELTSPIGNQAATEGAVFTLDVTSNFTDPEGQPLTFTAVGLPTGLAIATGGTISGTPSTLDIAGSPYAVVVTATDSNGAQESDTFDLTVADDPDALFVDGFESGDVSAWSSSVP